MLPTTAKTNNHDLLHLEDDFALVLTATICVDNLARVYPADKSVREQQYLDTLIYYLKNHPQIKKIIFIENSQSPLDRLQTAALDNPYNKKVEFISLDTNLKYGGRGKGFNECLLIEKGLSESSLISTVTHFGKLSGRICLVNLEEILARIPAHIDCLCDYKDLGYKLKSVWVKKKNFSPFCDTRFIVFNYDFYRQYIEPIHGDFFEKFSNKYFCIEVEYFNKINSLEDQAQIIKRLPKEPKFVGISGHSGGKKYGSKDYSSFSEQAKFKLRALARTLTPWLHI